MPDSCDHRPVRTAALQFSDALPVSRRTFLAGSAATLALSGYAPYGHAAGASPRLLTLVLRGALDGLALAAPVADANYQNLRGSLAMPADITLPLDGGFALNPAMPNLHALYRKRQALIVHAVATPYRARSHFDGQDVLESGLPGVGRANSGWLNRAIGQLGAARPVKTEGLAMGPVVPLLMRGPSPVVSWSPKVLTNVIETSTVDRLMDIYGETDPKLAVALKRGMDIQEMAGASGMGQRTQGRIRVVRDMIDTARAAARLMSTADGPRIGTLSVSGWDTHANEGVLKGRLYKRLKGLDDALKIFADGMGDAWSETVVLVVTEFGRTARVNGSGGSDHGTGTAAMLVGGAVRGGRVIADWPGLEHRNLFKGRDLKPTVDLRALIKGVLHEHLGLGHRALAEDVFPQTGNLRALQGLLA